MNSPPEPKQLPHAKRTRTAEGCIVERYRSRGQGGAIVDHVTLYTELELEPERRETVLRR